jgi:type II secretory pathway pseudopilin PulG
MFKDKQFLNKASLKTENIMKKTGFSVAEVLVCIVLVGVLTAATMPMLSQIMPASLNLDKNANDCIAANASTVGYNTTTGATTMPAAGTVCSNAILDCKNGRDKSCNTLIWNAEHGTAAQFAAAETVLRAACDQGATLACDYFIKKCVKSGLTATPFCNEASSFKDITYYLTQAANSVNLGSLYISKTLNDYVESGSAVIKAELYNNCDTSSSAIACSFLNAPVLIEDCNNANYTACRVGYDKNYNRTCAQIKENWSGALSNTYRITAQGRTTVLGAYCDMAKDEGGWTLIGKGEGWYDAALNAITSPTVGTSSVNVILPAATINAILANSTSKLFRFDNTTNSIKMYIKDTNPLFDNTLAHVWRSNGTTKCSLNYSNYIANSMTDTSIHKITYTNPAHASLCGFPIIGTHACGTNTGFILWHRGDAFNFDGMHPCSLGLGYYPTGQSLRDLWIK